MNLRTDCERAEVLAGAIALGEAGENDRDAYRSHLAQCRECCDALGGEREIERAVRVVASAREGESWTPAARLPLRRGARYYLWGWIALAAAVVIAVAAASHVPTHRVSVATNTPARSVSQADARAIAVLDTQVGPRREHQAESLSVGSSLASRRVTLQLSVDDRGRPKRCIVERSSGDDALDAALCR
ncbi:MAG: hypothetical protein JO311_00445, partial [Candidatus Eremiobacteraeota bacterium]|nr:hypothetical protein [Candidatus Eremiobacteraeota bacterium]